jgi:hypothetical protein
MIALMLAATAAAATGSTPRTATGWRTVGEFRQRGNDPKNEAFATGGRYRAEWRCLKGGWRVARMQTFAGGQ